MIHFEVVSRIQWVKCIEKSHFQNYSNSFTSGKQHKSDLNFKLISNSLSIVFLLFSHWNSKLLLIEPSQIWRRHCLKQMICILWTNTKVSKNREHIEYYYSTYHFSVNAFGFGGVVVVTASASVVDYCFKCEIIVLYPPILPLIIPT